MKTFLEHINYGLYEGKHVPLDMPMIEEGGADLSVKINDPKARQAFADRHNCDTANDKTSARYWSCRLPYYAKDLGLKGGGNYFW